MVPCERRGGTDCAGGAPIDKHVGSRARMGRRKLNMSRDALGLTFQQVQKYENGSNRVSASRLQQLSKILQVPVPFFFEGAPLRANDMEAVIPLRQGTTGYAEHDREKYKCSSKTSSAT
jgi:transcriptional regulator with XRE-family HTH domain